MCSALADVCFAPKVNSGNSDINWLPSATIEQFLFCYQR